MEKLFSIPDNKKLVVTYRVEPGCLGPEGKDKVSGFCQYVSDEIKTLDADYIIWDIVPRNDKSLPEMQYQVLGKKMSQSHAEQYLARFGKDLDEFESHLVHKLADLINDYMEHQ